MRKYFIALVALVMVLGFSGIAMGVLPTTTAHIDASATVNDYAEIDTSGTDAVLPAFTGNKNEVKKTSDVGTNGGFKVESNRNVRVTVSGAVLTTAGGDTIATEYELENDKTLAFMNNGDLSTIESNASSDITCDQGQGNGMVTYTVKVGGKLGEISGQKAGNYSASVIITVSAI